MPVVSSIFLVLSLVLAVVIGPQTRPWTWGPAMLALGVSVLTGLPSLWRRGKEHGDYGLISIALLTCCWFAVRAWVSPVAEYSQADLLLLCCAVGAFVSIRGISADPHAERVLSWGVALLLAANLVVIGMQIADNRFSPVFRTRAGDQIISGFFAHYNETANYLIASALLVGASACFGRHHPATRAIFGLLAVLGLAGVWFTTSRGGILGAAIGGGVFASLCLVVGHRKKAKWFAPAVLAVPVLGGIAICGFLFFGWESAMETRKAQDTSVEAILDNDCRLYFLGLAASCIADHPWTGGGSWSYSWENYQKWDPQVQGFSGVRPDLIHNELMQAATDYGLIGAALLVTLLAGLLLLGVFRLMFAKETSTADFSDAWRIGGSAALVGMLVQSSFSFVFHLLPGIILLGICMGMISRPGSSGSRFGRITTRVLITIPALGCLLALFPMGTAGTHTTRILWATFFSKHEHPGDEARIDALGEAIPVWPHSEFHLLRADLIAKSISSEPTTEAQALAERALDDYRAASRLIPREPYPVLSSANMLSFLKRDDEAEEAYRKAIQMQGGLESAFRARFAFSKHLLQKAKRLDGAIPPAELLSLMEHCADEFDKAVQETPGYIIGTQGFIHRVAIHEALGKVRESMGDFEGALKCYQFAASLPHGTRCHYRAGVVFGKLSQARWRNRQAAEAMYGFIEARKRVQQAGNQLPKGVSASDRVEYLRYLDRTIEFLKGARIEPKEW